MIRNHDKILSDYRNADFYRRVELYLQFKELRPDFLLIDRHDLNKDWSVGFTMPGTSLAARINVLFGYVAVGARKVFGIDSA